MTYQNESSYLWFPRRAPNMLLLAGLLGTVFGLARVVAGLHFDPKALANFEGVAAILGNALSDMKSAFACTLWGIVSALVVSLITGIVAGRQEALVGKALEIGFSRFAPLVLPAAPAFAVERLNVALQQLKGLTELLPAQMEKATEQFANVLTKAGEAMASNIGSLTRTSDEMQKSLKAIAAEVSRSTGALRQSAETVKESADLLNEHHKELTKTYGELHGMILRSQTKLDEHAGQLLAEIQSLAKDIATIQDSFTTSADKVLLAEHENAESLRHAIAAFEDAGRGFVDSGQAISVTLTAGFERLLDGLQPTMERFVISLGTLDNNQLLVVAEIRRLMERLDPRLLPEEAWNKVVGALAEAGGKMARLAALIERTPAAEPSRNDVGVAALAAEIEKAVGQITTTLGGLVTEIDNLRKPLAETRDGLDSGEVVRALARLSETLTEISTDQKQHLGHIADIRRHVMMLASHPSFRKRLWPFGGKSSSGV